STKGLVIRSNPKPLQELKKGDGGEDASALAVPNALPPLINAQATARGRRVYVFVKEDSFPQDINLPFRVISLRRLHERWGFLDARRIRPVSQGLQLFSPVAPKGRGTATQVRVTLTYVESTTCG